MNDRFKFRVWNKHINEYCDIQNLFILPTGETGYFITDGSYPHQRKFMHQEDMIIEQCTGLKDKNGNLIYEGDIIKAPKASDKFMQILFNEYCFECFDPDTHQYILSLSVVNLVSGSKNIEIIGNIHEQA